MKLQACKWMTAAGVLALAIAVGAPAALAQCGMPSKAKPMSWHPQYGSATSRLSTVGFDAPDPIVGMWHVVFTAQTANGEPVPGSGVVVDNSVVVWHSDGTEIMNSSRSAQDGNFCLGVWQHIGASTSYNYLLNHIPWAGNVFDPTAPAGTIGAPQAGVQILEQITLDPSGNIYHGTFTLRAYDTSGNVYTRFSGVLMGTRITPSTPFNDLL